MNVSEDHSPSEASMETSVEDDLRSLLPVVHDNLLEGYSRKLNLSLFEIRSQLVEAVPWWQIALEQGLSLRETEEILTEARKEALDQALQQGIIERNHIGPLDHYLRQQLELDLEKVQY